MTRMGLNSQSVINAAITLIEEKGYQNFSMSLEGIHEMEGIRHENG